MSFAANLIPYLSLIQRSLPEQARETIEGVAGKLLAYLQTGRRSMVEYNLDKLGIDNTGEISGRTIENWTYCLSDQIRSLWMSGKELTKMVKDQASKNLARGLNENRGVVLIGPHLGNYELAGSYLAAKGFPIRAVVEEIGGGHTSSVNRIRKRFGMGVTPYSDVEMMLRILRAGKVLVLLADRDIGGNGMEVRFGKSMRKAPMGPALLALRTGAVIQTGYFVRVPGNQRYLCVVHPPMDLRLSGSLRGKAEILTQRISRDLAAMVKRHPAQWFCFQDEWE
jgi:KDO2-lipid IV(A) lauroyltransferase